MSERSPELGQIQRWMLSVIQHPDGVEAGMASDAARSEIDVPVENVSHVICRSQSLNEIERLSIYANAYYARLLECLREEYPALAHALGEELFDGFAFGYLQAHPSTSYTLANLGAQFPSYLEETRPPYEADESGPDWADFMVDLARLERTYAEVFDAPGTEGRRCLEADDLLEIAPGRWPEVRLVPAPCLRLMRFRFPVHEFASAVRKKESPTIPAPVPTNLAIARRDFVVRRMPLSDVAYHLLERLTAGEPLADAIDAATQSASISDEKLGRQLHTWFEEWSAARLFLRVDLPA